MRSIIYILFCITHAYIVGNTMDRELHKYLDLLLKIGDNTDFDTIQLHSFIEVLRNVDSAFIDIGNNSILQEISFELCDTTCPQWMFIGSLCHTLLHMRNSLINKPEDLLSIIQQKNIRLSIDYIISIGILPSLLPGVGLPCNSKYVRKVGNDKALILQPLEKHHRLQSLCNFLYKICTINEFKSIVFTSYLGDYLAALFQLSYAPISKPKDEIPSSGNDFVMTHILWNKLKADQNKFTNNLNELILNSYPPLIMKEIIVLQGNQNPSPPPFMKRALTRQLSSYLISENGVINMFKCFLESSTIDTGTEWKYIDMIARIVSIKHGSLSIDEYLSNVCKQLHNIIHSKSNRDFIKVASACVSNLNDKYPNNQHVCKLINSLIQPFLLTTDDRVPGTVILSNIEVSNVIDTLDACFNDSKLSIPSHFLSPIINLLFCIRATSNKSIFRKKINNLILKHICSECIPPNEWFYSNIFSQHQKEMVIQNDIVLETVKDSIQIKKSGNSCRIVTVETAMHCLLDIVSENSALASKLFLFCLDILSSPNMSLINMKNESVSHDSKIDNSVNERTSNSLAILKALEKLSATESVIVFFKKNPSVIVNFIANLLLNIVTDIQTHKKSHSEECLVISLVLLSTILSENMNNETLKDSIKSIESSLEIFHSVHSSREVKYLCEELRGILSKTLPITNAKMNSEFAKALSDVCDELIPVRGHGLMQLTKLITQNDPETLSKKHYVQCIFQENLRHEDSYIYLAAINGYASLAKFSTEDVLETLTREYINSNNSSSVIFNEGKHNETRLKVGETLVQITKTIGDLAFPHRTLLLNTFLSGCHDHDDLIRTSSLSNLAEIACVMSYKLGPVIFEILSSVKNILDTDKSSECRRAAVLFISSLIKGLGKDALHFLKDSLLPVYRTLKYLYNDDKEDATVRLHAQVTLEELNSIVKDLLLKPLEMENKIFVLEK